MAPKKKVRRGSGTGTSKPSEVPGGQEHLPGVDGAGVLTNEAQDNDNNIGIEEDHAPPSYCSPHLLQASLSLVALFTPHLSQSDLNALSLTASWLLPYRAEINSIALRLPCQSHHKADLEALLQRRPKVHTLTGE